MTDIWKAGEREGRREDPKMHINFLTVNKLDEEKILLILRISKMPLENERTPTTTTTTQSDRQTN